MARLDIWHGLFGIAAVEWKLEVLYNAYMAQKKISKQQKAAITAALLAQFRKPHEFKKLTLLLIVWAHVRMRSGYTTIDAPSHFPATKNGRLPKKRGYSVKRPRSRFL